MRKLLISLCAVLALTACEKDDANTIKIGAVLPMTGANAPFGLAMRAGMESAVKDKGETKYTYKIVFEDGQAQAAKSVSAAQKLVSVDKVKAMFSHTNAIGRAIAPVTESANILNINATLETENTEPMGKTSFFQGPSVEGYHATFMRAMKTNKVKSAAIIAQNVGVSCPGAKVLAGKLNAAGIKATVECFNPGERDFKAIINKFSKVDAYMVSGFPPETDIVLRTLYTSGVKPEQIYGQGIDNGTDLTLYENTNCITPTSGTPEFVARMTRDYALSNMNLMSAAYDLVSLTIDAFEAVGPDNMDAVQEYIKQNATRDCMSGKCKLLPNGFIVNEAEWRTYHNGKPVVIEK